VLVILGGECCCWTRSCSINDDVFCGGFDNVGRVTKVRVLGDLLVLCGVVMVSFTALWGLSGGSIERWWLF